MESLKIPAKFYAYVLGLALSVSSQSPQLLSQDSLVVMGDTLAPLALLSGGDRIYTQVRNPNSSYYTKMVRVTSDGFRVWSTTVQFPGFFGNNMALFAGPYETSYFHYQRENGYYMSRIDRAGMVGPESILVSGLKDAWSLWQPIGSIGDTLAMGGPLFSPSGTCVVKVFTEAGMPVRQVSLQKPVVWGRYVAVAEAGNLLLVEWETIDVVRKLYLHKIDSKGGSVWRKSFNGGPDGDITSILNLPDGYLVAGYAKSTGSENYDAWLFKIGFDGELLWNRIWGDRWNDKINTIIACRNGGYLLGGQATVFESKKELHAALWRVNGNGDTSWSLLLPPYPIIKIIEPSLGTFHLLGNSAGQKKWFAILGPENPNSSRTFARTGPLTRAWKGTRAVFLPAGILPWMDTDGNGLLYIRPDGRTARVLSTQGRVTEQLRSYPHRAPGAAFLITSDPGIKNPVQGEKP